jgi:hypothetical protein
MKHMRNFQLLVWLSLVVFAAGLAGCGADIKVEEDDTTTTFTLLTASGDAYAMDGTWVEPCINIGGSTDSELSELTFSGLTGNQKKYRWVGFNNCTGIAPVLIQEDNFALEESGTASKGWDGAPPAGLAATVTVRTFIVIENGMTQGQMGIVDNAVSPPRAYFGDESTGVDASGYPNLLGPFPNTRTQ